MAAAPARRFPIFVQPPLTTAWMRLYCFTSRARHIACLFLAVVSVTAGCRATSSELLEAELRRKERENEQLTQRLRDCECEVRLLEADYERLLRELRATGKADIRTPVYLKQITLGRLTGGLDDDPNCPGDDALQVILEPRDLDDQIVKIPGHVHIDAYQITPQGLKQPLSSWDLPARELRGKWETPLIGSPGYRLVLRWKILPHYERLRLVVRFTTLDGQVFETDRDITIRPPRRDPERCRIPPTPTCPPSSPIHTMPTPDPDLAPVLPFPSSSQPLPPSAPTLGTPLRRAVTSPTPQPILVAPPPATNMLPSAPSPLPQTPAAVPTPTNSSSP
ncbi:MAG: hypothetical protein RMI91_01945 [Gemmatales bacterium]|nr:hypothetical protein [Gemmatales bacterium]MDW7993389.1 hypothetical protein [Gemmatales bacterium]